MLNSSERPLPHPFGCQPSVPSPMPLRPIALARDLMFENDFCQVRLVMVEGAGSVVRALHDVTQEFERLMSGVTYSLKLMLNDYMRADWPTAASMAFRNQRICDMVMGVITFTATAYFGDTTPGLAFNFESLYSDEAKIAVVAILMRMCLKLRSDPATYFENPEVARTNPVEGDIKFDSLTPQLMRDLQNAHQRKFRCPLQRPVEVALTLLKAYEGPSKPPSFNAKLRIHGDKHRCYLAEMVIDFKPFKVMRTLKERCLYTVADVLIWYKKGVKKHPMNTAQNDILLVSPKVLGVKDYLEYALQATYRTLLERAYGLEPEKYLVSLYQCYRHKMEFKVEDRRGQD